MNKEHNFVSAVIYLQPNCKESASFVKRVGNCLDEHFAQYEIIAVSTNVNQREEFAVVAKELKKSVTMISLPKNHTHEQCMNAGTDISIGDYVFEFESVDLTCPVEMIWTAYQEALKGYDIVSICPRKQRFFSRAFYDIFNTHSMAVNQLRTDAFRVISRRAINRAHEISNNLPYRKAAYAACGLQMSELEFDGQIESGDKDRVDLAINSLVLYTNFGYMVSIRLTLAMIVITLLELIYAIVLFLSGKTILGWTTTMIVLTVGLTGLFAILAIAVKYLALILELSFKKQDYLVESVQKYN